MNYCIIFVIFACLFLRADGLFGLIGSAITGITSIIGGITSGVQATQGLIGAIRRGPQQGGPYSDPAILEELAGHQRESREQFEKVFNGIYGIGNQLHDNQQQTNASFERVFTQIGSLEVNVEAGREENRQNFLKISEHIGQLGDKIDQNQKEVLLNFATVFDKFRFLGSHLDVIRGKIERTFDVIGSQREVDQHLGPNIVDMNNKLAEFKKHTEAMQISFGYFMEYSADVMAYDNDTLMDFVRTTLSHSDSSPMILSQKIYNMLATADGIIQHFSQDGIEDYLVCTKKKSPQQVLYGLYSMAVFAELKGLITSTFARDLKLYFGGSTFSKERMTELAKSLKRMEEFTGTVQRAISYMGRRLRNCDSPSNQMGTSYYRFDDFSMTEANSRLYISLDTVESDITNKRVVTGVKLTEHFGEIHMQIQEAQMGPFATINGSTAYWVPVDRGTLGRKLALTRNFARIDIDVFSGLSGYVVTGVRFREVDNGVTLETRVSPFDSMTGALDNAKSKWLNNMNKQNQRQEIKLENVNSPFDATVTPVVQSSSNQYLYFTSSKQSRIGTKALVPFFDTRPLVPSTLAPLSGLGLLYKSASERFGGYLAPVVVGLDYAEYTKVELPKMDTKRWELTAVLPKGRTVHELHRKLTYEEKSQRHHRPGLEARSIGVQISHNFFIIVLTTSTIYLYYIFML